MKNKRILRVGVFGVGSLGQWHARIYSELPQVELCGVYDADPHQAQAIAGRYNTRAFATADELAGTIDAASLVVPTHLHLEAALPLIRRGIHLLVEKPIAATVEEAEELVAASDKAGITLQVGHVERFNPVIGFLESRLVRPRFIEATRLATYPPPRPGQRPRGTEVSVILDLMIHDLEIVQHLVQSEVRAIQAFGATVLSESEDMANARLTFANGCVANINASRVGPERLRKISLFQDDGHYLMDYQEQNGMILRNAGTTMESTPVKLERREPLLLELKAFSDCVLQQGKPLVSGHQALESLKLAVAIRRCISEGGE